MRLAIKLITIIIIIGAITEEISGKGGKRGEIRRNEKNGVKRQNQEGLVIDFEGIDAETIIRGDNFLKITFYYTYSDFYPDYEIEGFIIQMKGLNSEYQKNFTLKEENANFQPIDDDHLYSYIVFDDLIPGNYSFDFQAIYDDEDNADSISEILLSFVVDTRVDFLCTQETFASFFSTEIYSRFELLNNYRICGLDFEKYEEYERELGHCAVFYENQLKMALVVFQGTANTTDVITDLQNINLVTCENSFPNFPCEGKIGQGFSESYNLLREDYLPKLVDLQKRKNVKYVLVTGHSKGASEATLAAVDIAHLKLFDQLHITTFGYPSFTDQSFVDFWNSKINEGQSGIVSTWHSHVDNCDDEGEDVVVTSTEALFASIDTKSVFKDTRCYSSNPLLAVVYDHSSLRSSTGSQVPDSGYYFIGTNPKLNGIKVEYRLDAFDDHSSLSFSYISSFFSSNTSSASSLSSLFFIPLFFFVIFLM